MAISHADELAAARQRVVQLDRSRHRGQARPPRRAAGASGRTRPLGRHRPGPSGHHRAVADRDGAAALRCPGRAARRPRGARRARPGGGRRGLGAEVVAGLAEVARELDRLEVATLLSASTTTRTPSCRSTPARAASTRWTGPRCCSACTCGGPRTAASRPRSTTSPTARRPASSPRPSRCGSRRLRLAVRRARRPPARADQPVRLPGPPPDLVRAGRRRPGPARARRRGRRPRRGPARRRLPLVGAGRAERQHDRLRGAAHPPADRDRVVSCQNEKSQHQNKAAALRVLKAKLAELERQKRAEELDELRGGVRTSGSAPRSAATSCTRTRWSRTCAPSTRPATSQACSTATSTSSSRPSCVAASRRAAET
jgi:hypothetical protein